jgi:hypothetical protein
MRAGFLLAALLLAVPVAREAQTPATGETVIRGTVFDSLRMRPLGDANVQIASEGGSWARSLDTGAGGAFEFTGVPPGVYLIGFFHPKLDSLGIQAPTFRLEVRPGPPIQMRLVIPSARTIVRALCGRNRTSDSTGLFLGFVRGAENAKPRPDGKLVIRWAEFVIQTDSTSDSALAVALLRGAGRVHGHVSGATGRPIQGARVTVYVVPSGWGGEDVLMRCGPGMGSACAGRIWSSMAAGR